VRILVLGGGGREHALAWKLAKNPTVDKMFAAPGNAGLASLAECVQINPSDPGAVATFAEDQGIDLTVVGPEAPLVSGVADEMMTRGLPVFGPTRAGARLESSKSWAKDLMLRAGVPTARSGAFTAVGDALEFIDTMSAPYVVKADGLAAGKGVLICEARAAAETALRLCLDQRVFGDAGATVVVEEYLEGAELSVFCLTDGRDVLPLIEARDFKRAYDGDEGPNTGGMGAYSPVPDSSPIVPSLRSLVFEPIVSGMEAAGIRYVGVLYAGLMLTKTGPKVLEFNARFGDPEAQVIIPRLESDLGELLLASVEGNLSHYAPRWTPRSCVGVVLASANYPEASPAGFEIRGLDEAAAMPDVAVFHAGTALRGAKPVTAGGRVLAVTALGDDVVAARERAYEAASVIEFEGKRFRSDIAATAAREG
jgi:phosphoribosylamine--glycine ligase